MILASLLSAICMSPLVLLAMYLGSPIVCRNLFASCGGSVFLSLRRLTVPFMAMAIGAGCIFACLLCSILCRWWPFVTRECFRRLFLYIPVETLLRESQPFYVVFLLQISVHLADKLGLCCSDVEVIHAYRFDQHSVSVRFREYAWFGVGLLLAVFLRWYISPSKYIRDAGGVPYIFLRSLPPLHACLYVPSNLGCCWM